MIRFLTATFAVVLACTTADAATYNTIVKYQNTTCAIQTGSTTPSLSTCSVDETINGAYGYWDVDIQNTARSEAGDLGVSGSMTIDGQVTAGAGIWSTTAGAYFADTLTFGSDSGTYRMWYDIAGTVSTSNVSAAEAAEASISVWASGTTIYEYGITDRYFTSDSIVSTGSTGIGYIDFAYTGGSFYLDLRMNNSLRCWYSGAGLCTADVQFFNSIRIIGGEALDSFGNVVSISSTSGFDYINGLEPHDVGGAVPLPAGIWLMAAGIGAFGLNARSRRRG